MIMKKIMTINKMSCNHCKAKVEDALNLLDGVKAKVDLKKGIATVSLKSDISDAVLSATVNGLGFEVVGIVEK